MSFLSFLVPTAITRRPKVGKKDTTRWHRPSCIRPMVVVAQGRPLCKSCNEAPDLKSLVETQAAVRSSVSSLPPDEPPGQLGLWWPPCVPYVERGKREDAWSAPLKPTGAPEKNTCSLQCAKEPTVYASRLRRDEFRVLYLSPVHDVGYPVHLHLETHADEHHPEYETVSYTWGGEDGDSAPSKPVYVGPYWDILWQTRNCWEMLRYLRPRRGVRTVWVDAICINQTDLQERQEQVAKMGLIYERALRVVVYLGPDVTPPTAMSSPYPRRHYLQDLESLTVKPRLPSSSSNIQPSHSLTLSGLLEREYFRRLWIIQELIMSRNITMRIGDVEFIVDREVNFRMERGSASVPQANHHLPWLQFITQRFIDGAGGNDLLSAVDLARQSRASDPRDKIFGLLGLVRSDGEGTVAPAYSISFRHLLLGYFAYCLLTKKDMRVIVNAAGTRAIGGMPSWAPLVPDDVNGGLAAQRTIPSLGDRRSDYLYELDDFVDAYMRHHSVPGEEASRPWDMSERPGQPLGRATARLWKAREGYYTCTKLGFDWEARLERNDGAKETEKSFSGTGCWHSRPWIDSSTGAVSLSPVHILSFDDLKLSEAQALQHGKIFTYVFPAGESTLYLHTADAIFDDVNKPSENHLFAFCDGIQPRGGPSSDFFGSRLCVMRRLEEAEYGGEEAFQMVSAAVDACFHVKRRPSRSYDQFSVPDLPIAPMWNSIRSSSKILLLWNSELSVALPLVRDEGLQADDILPDQRTGWRSRNPGDGREVLTVEALSRTLFSLLETLRSEWVVASSEDGAPDLHHAGRYFTYNTVDYFDFPWPMLVIPGVSGPKDFFRILQAVLDAERSASAAGFFEVYFDVLRDFEPRVLEWDNQRRFNKYGTYSRGEKAVMTLVEMKFEPHQFGVLEAVLNFIKEDVEYEIFLPAGTRRPDPADGRPQPTRRQLFMPKTSYPSFLRIGWKETPTTILHGGRRMADIPWRGDADGIYPLDTDRWPRHDETIREHRGQTIWVAFDLLSFTMWAQAHPCMTVLRGLTRFCRDGEDEMTRLLRVPEEEDKKVAVPLWPNDIVEDFCMSVENRSVKIV